MGSQPDRYVGKLGIRMTIHSDRGDSLNLHEKFLLFLIDKTSKITSRTRIQKMVFLFQKYFNHTLHSDIFEDYQYLAFGPHSRRLNLILDLLIDSDLIHEQQECHQNEQQEENLACHFSECYFLTWEGEQIVPELSEYFGAEFEQTFDQFLSIYSWKSLRQLIDDTYHYASMGDGSTSTDLNQEQQPKYKTVNIN